VDYYVYQRKAGIFDNPDEIFDLIIARKKRPFIFTVFGDDCISIRKAHGEALKELRQKSSQGLSKGDRGPVVLNEARRVPIKDSSSDLARWRGYLATPWVKMKSSATDIS